MLAALGFITVLVMLVLIMTKKASPLVALIVVPVVTGIIACAFIVTDPEAAPGVVDFVANFKGLGGMITGSKGIGSVAATGVMFIFSILFFGILTDAGTFRPIIRKILNVVGTDPIKICIGSALLAMIVHLDGSGAVTFLICIPPLVPLYDAVGMKRTTLATVVALAAGTMNTLPWGGPTIRAHTALAAMEGTEATVTEFFLPTLPAIIVGLICVFAIAILLGSLEKKRLGSVALTGKTYVEPELTEEEKKLARPHLFVVNIILIVAAIVSLLFSGFAPAVVFMVFYVLATLINYPKVSDSKARVDAHAKDCLMMCSVLFAAGCFTGIMTGTGMITEMANALVSVIPNSLGKFFPLIVGIIGMPASLLFDPDSFYYGVLPVLAQTAEGFGVLAADVGRAAFLGQMTVGFPVSPLTASTFLLVGLSGVDLGEHQKKTIPFAWIVSLVMVFVAILIGAIQI
ncbi:citrate:proton symporter [Intestinimonas aquisgranensis]|nr:citrate:proton symporter [Intestinimonas aquisgranensis]